MVRKKLYLRKCTRQNFNFEFRKHGTIDTRGCNHYNKKTIGCAIMNIFDYPHIQEAIENVANDLKYKSRSCVIATMGIGKSAIAAATMLDYANQKILFSAPNQLILSQMQNHLINMGYDLIKDFNNLQFCTYSQLHAWIKKGKIPEFDLFICDEFHAIAKKKRYDSIKKLFTYDRDKKYLGLSATPILQWEYEQLEEEQYKTGKKRVNMASVLYDDNVSFFYSLDEAFQNGLFSVPVYYEFFTVVNEPRQEAIKILKKRIGKTITEEQIDALATYLNKRAGIVSILQKYLNVSNTKIMFYCRDFKDLLEKERLLKEIFPELDIYKTACRLPKKENAKNIATFRNNEFNHGNSKVLLSIRQVAEGFHTDGNIQIIFGSKTRAYRDFLQKFGRGCSLKNKASVKILDLGGNLTRISSLDFLNFRNSLKNQDGNKGIANLPNITLGGNILDINNFIQSLCQTVFVSKKEKTDIYYERMISNSGLLKDAEEKYKDGTYVKDWYKEMMTIASEELKLIKQNPDYKISSENMYIIETLAYIDNYLKGIVVPTAEDKMRTYYEKALACKNILPKSEEYRFSDGVLMATWYQSQNKKVRSILKCLKQENYSLSARNYELIKWFYQLHVDLKNAWLDERLRMQRKEQEQDKYIKWRIFSEATRDNPKLLNTKKLCEGIENFYCLEDYFSGVEERMNACAAQNFVYSQLDMESIKRHLVFKRK